MANTRYNITGQVWQVSNPYTTTASGGTYLPADWNKPYTEHQYDAMGREIKTISPDPTISQTMAYNQWTTTLIDANGHQHQTIADAFGRVVTVKEFNAGATYTTTYQYNTVNQLISVLDNAGNTTTMAYDKLGRKTGMIDPDLGQWSYGYDNAGNLTRQTDNKQQTTCLYYDALNRLVGKNYRSDTLCPGTASSYQVANTYDIGTNGIGQRTRIDDASGWTTFAYDLQGRLTSQTNSIIGASSSYTTSWTYDAMGRTRTMTYPDGEQVTTAYNSQGLPATLSNYVTASSYNPAGQLTFLTFGNNVTTQYGYNTQNLRLASLLTTTSQEAKLQDLAYQYDNRRYPK